LRFLNSLQAVSLLLLRVAVAIVFIAHGYPKLAHAGPGMQEFFVHHGLPGYFLYVSGILELFGGVLLLLGLFTRVTALLLATEMVVAIWKVDSGHGYLAVRDYELPMVLATTCFVLATIGAGMISLDQPLFESKGWGSSRSRKK